jgi:hypothetical protein
MLEYSFLIDTVTKKFEFDYSKTNPVIPLIGSLSKAQFCNVSGYPVSKAIWTGFSDSDMIDRFGRICRNLSHYYSGSSNKQSLYQIKYILRLSCARNSNKLVSIKLQYALFCKDWVQGFSKNSLRKKKKCFLWSCQKPLFPHMSSIENVFGIWIFFVSMTWSIIPDWVWDCVNRIERI